jgi:hypothetical protein
MLIWWNSTLNYWSTRLGDVAHSGSSTVCAHTQLVGRRSSDYPNCLPKCPVFREQKIKGCLKWRGWGLNRVWNQAGGEEFLRFDSSSHSFHTKCRNKSYGNRSILCLHPWPDEPIYSLDSNFWRRWQFLFATLANQTAIETPTAGRSVKWHSEMGLIVGDGASFLQYYTKHSKYCGCWIEVVISSTSTVVHPNEPFFVRLKDFVIHFKQSIIHQNGFYHNILDHYYCGIS